MIRSDQNTAVIVQVYAVYAVVLTWYAGPVSYFVSPESGMTSRGDKECRS